MTKKDLLAIVIENAPEGAFWGIQGLYSENYREALASVLISDDLCHSGYLVADYTIILNENNRKFLIELIKKSDFISDIVQNYIYDGQVVLFVSYDNFEENIVYKKFIPVTLEAKLREKKLISFS